MRNLLTFVFLLVSVSSLGQTSNDSATYWVNPKYLACLDSGKSVCNCQEQNNFLILDIDTIQNNVTIEPSIYFSWEILEFSIIPSVKKNNFTIITPGLGLDSGTVINLNEKQLTLTSSKQSIVFTKIKVNKLDKTVMFDLGEQIGLLSCKPLLKYAVKPCNGSEVFITHEQLANYIAKGQISISCSDDFYYDEMIIENSENEYFLIYNTNSINIHKNNPIRGRGNAVDIKSLKECQTFYKVIK